MLLDHVGQRAAAGADRGGGDARRSSAGVGLTRDLGGDGTTATITEAIIANLPRASSAIGGRGLSAAACP